MTIVEFFDTNHVENVISALTCNPDKVILIGNNTKRIDRYINIYKKIVEKRDLKTEFFSRSVNKNNLDDVIETLTEIVEENDECVFDLEGGEELLLVGAGYIAGKYSDRVRMHSFNIRNNTIIDCDSDGENNQIFPIEMSIEENVRIYAGQVVAGQEGFEEWDYSDDFKEDIFILWEICKESPKEWNKFCSCLSEEINATIGNSFVLDRMTAGITWNAIAARIDHSILKRLNNVEIVRNLRIGSDGIHFDFKNEQIKRCLLKSGQVLELYVTFIAKDVTDRIGKPVYNDVQCGVLLDWDSPDINNDKYDSHTTMNEIDIMLMKGIVPVFISCKNGVTDINELYKLNTVAERFGGKYARKILLISDHQNSSNTPERVLARAEDMNIIVVPNVAKLSYEELEDKIRNLWH
jgi:hypothetical protein